MSTIDPFAANRAMWDETADVHARVKLDGLLQAAASPEFSTFDSVELRAFQQLGLLCAAIGHSVMALRALRTNFRGSARSVKRG